METQTAGPASNLEIDPEEEENKIQPPGPEELTCQHVGPYTQSGPNTWRVEYQWRGTQSESHSPSAVRSRVPRHLFRVLGALKSMYFFLDKSPTVFSREALILSVTARNYLAAACHFLLK